MNPHLMLDELRKAIDQAKVANTQMVEKWTRAQCHVLSRMFAAATMLAQPAVYDDPRAALGSLMTGSIEERRQMLRLLLLWAALGSSETLVPKIEQTVKARAAEMGFVEPAGSVAAGKPAEDAMNRALTQVKEAANCQGPDFHIFFNKGVIDAIMDVGQRSIFFESILDEVEGGGVVYILQLINLAHMLSIADHPQRAEMVFAGNVFDVGRRKPGQADEPTGI